MSLQDHETFYIQANPKNLSEKELAKKFGVSEKTIKRIQYLHRKKVGDVRPYDKVETPQPTPVEEGPKSPAIDGHALFGKASHPHNPDVVVATVSTPAASQFADEQAKVHRKKNPFTGNRRLDGCVHRPMGNKKKE